MSDLNILHAQNADLKSRVSDSDLACDARTSVPDFKDVEAFELAMRGGEKSLPQSDFACQSPATTTERKNIEALEIAMRGGEKGFSQHDQACHSLTSSSDHKNFEAISFTMREGGQQSSLSAASTHLPHGDTHGQLTMQGEEGKGIIDTFKNAMREPSLSPDNPPAKKQEGKQGVDAVSVKSDSSQDFEQPKADTLPQAQLSSLFSMACTFNDVEAPATVAAPHAILSEEDLNMLVERILVSAASNGTQEVRLILNERVLAGTEIILNRDISGQLVVSLHCTDANTFQTLVASQFDLKQMLEASEENPVQVSVDIHQDGNDAERRSQGYFDYEPDQLWKRDNA